VFGERTIRAECCLTLLSKRSDYPRCRNLLGLEQQFKPVMLTILEFRLTEYAAACDFRFLINNLNQISASNETERLIADPGRSPTIRKF
jgi:hypothetical protein